MSKDKFLIYLLTTTLIVPALAMGAVEKDGTINVVVSKYIKNLSLDICD
jgi:hypothetical protein